VRRIKFDVSWIDHDGMRRAAVGIGDLTDTDAAIELKPRTTS
jgi:hypothetical protein